MVHLHIHRFICFFSLSHGESPVTMVRPWGLLEIVTSKLESESPKVAAKNKADSLSAPHKARVEAESQGSKVGEIYTQNIDFFLVQPRIASRMASWIEELKITNKTTPRMERFRCATRWKASEKGLKTEPEHDGFLAKKKSGVEQCELFLASGTTDWIKWFLGSMWLWNCITSLRKVAADFATKPFCDPRINYPPGVYEPWGAWIWTSAPQLSAEKGGMLHLASGMFIFIIHIVIRNNTTNNDVTTSNNDHHKNTIHEYNTI